MECQSSVNCRFLTGLLSESSTISFIQEKSSTSSHTFSKKSNNEICKLAAIQLSERRDLFFDEMLMGCTMIKMGEEADKRAALQQKRKFVQKGMVLGRRLTPLSILNEIIDGTEIKFCQWPNEAFGDNWTFAGGWCQGTYAYSQLNNQFFIFHRQANSVDVNTRFGMSLLNKLTGPEKEPRRWTKTKRQPSIVLQSWTNRLSENKGNDLHEWKERIERRLNLDH